MKSLYEHSTMLVNRQFAANRPKHESPEEHPSHHEKPREPGSDHDHEHEAERERERKRRWDEQHKPH
ncbi:MAG: hypothetical protein ACHQJ6_02825 [Candidatus Berkiellales bacterium]